MRTTNFLLIAIVLILAGCTGRAGNPVTPPSQNPDSVSNQLSQASDTTSNRLLLGMWEVQVSDDHKSIKVTPDRGVEMHLNAVKSLEVAPCTDCLKIDNIVVKSPNEIWLDLTIKHPFKTNLNMTVFDPRAIFITGSDYIFPLGDPDRTVALGDSLPRLINFDGYTNLFNPTDYPPSHNKPEVYTYYRGKYATGGDFNATLNPFLAYAQANPRRMFTPGSEETRTVKLHIPTGGFEFGYAVDSSWANPGKKVIDPVADFPPEANCIEPYEISVSISDCYAKYNDTAGLYIDIYDHQDQDHITGVFAFAPDLFTGQQGMYFIYENGTEVYRYAGWLTNGKSTPPGKYPVLFRATDSETDPNFGQLSAWQLAWVEVIPLVPPIAKAKVAPIKQNTGQVVNFKDNGSFDPDGGEIKKFEWDWNNDGVFEEGSQYQHDATHTWDTPGTYYVQFRVTDDEGKTDTLDTPLEITIADNMNPFNPVDVTPEWLTLNYQPMDACVDGNYLYVAEFNDVDIFDVTDPSDPVWLKRVHLPGNASGIAFSNGYVYVAEAKAGLAVVDVDPVDSASVVDVMDTPDDSIGVTINGSYAYVGDKTAGLLIVDVSVPDQPSILNTIDTPGYASKVAVDNGYAYVADDVGGLQIIDVDPIDSASIVKAIDFKGDRSVGVAVSGGYAYVGCDYQHFNVIDITPPESATIVKTVTDIYNGGAVTVYGNYAYVIDRGGGLAIIDISAPESAAVVGLAPTSGLFVTINNGYAYINGAVVDIDPPESPYLLRSISAGGESMVKSGNYLYIAGLYSGVQIIDISQPEFPHIVRLVSSNGGDSLALDNGYAFTSLGGGDLAITDIDPVDTAHLVKQLDSGGPLLNWIAVSNGYAFTTIGGTSDLQVFDIDPPDTEHWVTRLSIESYPLYGLAHIPGYLIVTQDREIGSSMLFIDISVPESPSVFKTIDIEKAGPVTVSNGFAYVAGYDGILQAVDIDPVDSAHMVGTTSVLYGGNNIVIDGNYAFVQTGMYTAIVDITSPESPQMVNTIPFYSYIDCGIAVDGQYAYLSSAVPGDAQFRIFKLY